MKLSSAGFLVLILSVDFLLIGAAEADNRWGGEFIVAPSYIPQEEAYIHIAGGFFSVFESRMGRYFGAEQECCGSICIQLTKLEYSSPFVYLPEGQIQLEDKNGDIIILKMRRLDYVFTGENEAPGYRIQCEREAEASGRGDRGNAYLICSATEDSSPELIGCLYLMDGERIVETYSIRISGRRESEADNHLHKVVARVSQFN